MEVCLLLLSFWDQIKIKLVMKSWSLVYKQKIQFHQKIFCIKISLIARIVHRFLMVKVIKIKKKYVPNLYKWLLQMACDHILMSSPAWHDCSGRPLLIDQVSTTRSQILPTGMKMEPATKKYRRSFFENEAKFAIKSNPSLVLILPFYSFKLQPQISSTYLPQSCFSLFCSRYLGQK